MLNACFKELVERPKVCGPESLYLDIKIAPRNNSTDPQLYFSDIEVGSGNAPFRSNRRIDKTSIAARGPQRIDILLGCTENTHIIHPGYRVKTIRKDVVSAVLSAARQTFDDTQLSSELFIA